MTDIILSFVFPVLNFIGFIVCIVVLIKQFKHAGVLHGILGIITCSLWTFIWGWIKHKNLALTKLMITWTVVTVVPLLMIPVFGAAMFGEVYKIMNEIKNDPNLVVKQDRDKMAVPGIKRNKSRKRPPKRNVNRAQKDWSAEAMALWQNGQYSDPNRAKQYWDKAIAANPKVAEAYNNRGLALYNLKQHQQAIVDFNQAIQINPKYTEAYNNRGNAYYAMEQYQQAEAQFSESIMLNPKYAKAHLNRGLAKFQMQKIPESCSDFKRACNLGDCDGLQWATQNGHCK